MARARHRKDPWTAAGARRWWWLFIALIALPSVLLAALGFWAVRAERLDRERRTSEQQVQVARLADQSVDRLLEQMDRDAYSPRPGEPGDPEAFAASFPGVRLASWLPGGIVSLWPERVYLAPPGARPSELLGAGSWPAATSRQIESVLTLDARGQTDSLALHLTLLRSVEPRLAAWSRFLLARRAQSPAALLDAVETDPDGRSPGGIPVPLLASLEIERLDPARREAYRPVLDHVASAFALGRWWLGAQEYRLHAERLANLTGRAVADSAAGALLERLAARTPPEPGERRVLKWASGGPATLLIRQAESVEGPISALLVPDVLLRSEWERLFASALTGTVAVRDPDGTLRWGHAAGSDSIVVDLASLPGWTVTFGDDPAAVGAQTLVWFGFIAALLVMLGIGVTMTVVMVRREVLLARLQDEFVAAVSHEFKTPITGIQLLLERLEDERPLPVERQKGYLALIRQELKRLEWLVHRVLRSQKIQMRTQRYRFEPVDVAATVAEVAEIFDPVAATREIRIERRLESGLPHVLADRTALADAVRSLLENALQYSPDGSVVRCAVSGGKSEITVSIEDEGIGIDPAELESIFRKFYRGRHATERYPVGTGLGLALVKATVEAHQGRVEASNNAGGGATFRITLPVNGLENSHGADSDR